VERPSQLARFAKDAAPLHSTSASWDARRHERPLYDCFRKK
jgi:hypothetical protein